MDEVVVYLGDLAVRLVFMLSVTTVICAVIGEIFQTLRTVIAK